MANDFKVLSDAEHIRLRAQMYVGSITTQETSVFISGSGFQKMQINEGLLKIINEILDNSVDEAVRTQFEFGNRIDVTITPKSVIITDNGRGIPIELLLDTDGSKVYRPVAAWSKARAGSNFNDAERVSIGSNGVGSFLTSVLSLSFIGTTSDSHNSLVYTAAKGKTINVELSKSKKHGTSVEFMPDLGYFGMDEIDRAHVNVLHERVLALSVAFPKIRFTFNGEVIKGLTAQKYYDAVLDVKTPTGQWYGVSKSAGSFDTTSIVNGLIVPNGGSHIDYFVNGLMSALSDLIKRRKKVEIAPNKLKGYINCYSVITEFPALKFDSQTKTKITNSQSEVKNHIGEIDFNKYAQALFKNEDLITEILAFTKLQEDLDAKKALEKLDKPKKKIVSDNYVTNIGRMKNLFLVEGLSAQSGLVASFGRNGNAFFAMRGVPLNSWECTHQQMTSNKELSMVYQIIKNSPDDINIIISSDNDLDGKKIAGLLIAFFKRYMPEMYEANRICLLSTPIASTVDNKGNLKAWVYDFSGIASLGNNIRYHKGLGSWSADKLKYVIEVDGIDKMIQPITTPTDELLNSWFISDNADKRKSLIEAAPAFDIMAL